MNFGVFLVTSLTAYYKTFSPEKCSPYYWNSSFISVSPISLIILNSNSNTARSHLLLQHDNTPECENVSRETESLNIFCANVKASKCPWPPHSNAANFSFIIHHFKKRIPNWTEIFSGLWKHFPLYPTSSSHKYLSVWAFPEYFYTTQTCKRSELMTVYLGPTSRSSTFSQIHAQKSIPPSEIFVHMIHYF